uniref:Ig-like domain-containing protein n=1 Tax=Dicentrarchus labrax TaxID=13489 RepID=A0A8C4IHB4_DICLA
MCILEFKMAELHLTVNIASHSFFLLSMLDQIIPPSFTRKLKKTEGIKGSFAHLECLVSGSLPITIQWYKDEKEIQTDEKHKCTFFENVAFLEISNLNSKDSGNYTCIAKNKAGTVQCSGILFISQAYIYFSLPEPPCLIEKPESMNVLPVTWYKHDTKVTDGGNYRTSFVDSVAVLELHSTSFDDDGVYTCEAQNDAGSVSCSTTLTVKGHGTPNILALKNLPS